MMNAQTIRTQRFGSGAVILRATGAAGLTDEEIQARAPSVFADDKHESRSDRYTYIPTRDLLAGLRRADFVPFEVRQGGSRDEAKRGFTKHMVRMRHRSAEAVRGGLIPEVIALNSHDGTSSYVLSAGIFRMACTNGLIVGECLEEVRVPHRGDVLGQVIEGAYRVLEDLPKAIDGAHNMSALQIAPAEAEALAESAATLRWEPGTEQPTARALLAPRRRDDTGSDLWSTFNRLQENLIRGGVSYVHTDQRGRQQHRASRPVRSIDGDRGVNRALWMLAERMRELKTAH